MGLPANDAHLVAPFITATIDCLAQMAGMQPVCTRTFVRADPHMHGEVTGVIGMTGGLTGSCSVSFPLALAKHVVARFLAEPETAITEAMIADGIGEVANMVAGGAKSHAVAAGIRFAISTPTLIIGAQACLFNPAGTVSFACEFTAAAERTDTFLVEVAVRRLKRL